MKLEEAKSILRAWLLCNDHDNSADSDTAEAVMTVLDYVDEGREGRTIHELKLSMHFCDAVYSGLKTFELRKNDRGYQTGDLVRFTPIKFDETNPSDRFPDHPIRKKMYEITYILSGWGLNPDCVAFGIREVTA